MDNNKKKQILVVDDEEILRLSLKATLSREGYDISFATDGKDGLDKVKAGNFDLVITDINMPRMTGLELLKEIKKFDSEIPVVVVTGFPTVTTTKQALTEGACNYIKKPFDIDEIIDVVRKALEARESSLENKRIFPYINAHYTMEIPNDLSLQPGIIFHLTQSAKSIGFDKGLDTISLALNEAITNAMKHGNKLSPDKKVRISCYIRTDRVEVSIADEGDGFDVKNIPDPRDPENLLKRGGRGILLINCFMDEVRFNSKGNEITMVKYKR